MDGDIIPDSLLAGLLQGFSIDSIRIQFNSKESGIVDAYGTVKMQNKPCSESITLSATHLTNDSYVLTMTDQAGKICKVAFEQIENEKLQSNNDISDLANGISDTVD